MSNKRTISDILNLNNKNKNKKSKSEEESSSDEEYVDEEIEEEEEQEEISSQSESEEKSESDSEQEYKCEKCIKDKHGRMIYCTNDLIADHVVDAEVESNTSAKEFNDQNMIRLPHYLLDMWEFKNNNVKEIFKGICDLVYDQMNGTFEEQEIKYSNVLNVLEKI